MTVLSVSTIWRHNAVTIDTFEIMTSPHPTTFVTTRFVNVIAVRNNVGNIIPDVMCSTLYPKYKILTRYSTNYYEAEQTNNSDTEGFWHQCWMINLVIAVNLCICVKCELLHCGIWAADINMCVSLSPFSIERRLMSTRTDVRYRSAIAKISLKSSHAINVRDRVRRAFLYKSLPEIIIIIIIIF